MHYFKAAYDSVLWSGLFSALNSPVKLIHLVHELVYGLRHGDALKEILFKMILECAIRKSIGTFFTNYTQIIAYADDIAIVIGTCQLPKKSSLSLKRISCHGPLR